MKRLLAALLVLLAGAFPATVSAQHINAVTPQLADYVQLHGTRFTYDSFASLSQLRALIAPGEPIYNIGAQNLAIGINNFDPNNGQPNNVNNLAIGINTLSSMTNAENNLAIGPGVLQHSTTGFDNVGAGFQALPNLTTGVNDTAVGTATCRYVTTGFGNSCFGHGAMAGDDFTPSNNTGSVNTALGGWVMQELTTGISNLAAGVNAGMDLTTGSSNVYLGNSAGACSADLTATVIPGGCGASFNVGVGFGALLLNKADALVALGWSSLLNNVSGVQQTGLGFSTLLSSVGDTGNTAGGYASLNKLNGGNYNSAYGALTASFLTTGSFNVIHGYSAMVAATTASNDTVIGYGAMSSANYSNVIAIGYNAQPTGPNQTVLGTAATSLSFIAYGLPTFPSLTTAGVVKSDTFGNFTVQTGVSKTCTALPTVVLGVVTAC